MREKLTLKAGFGGWMGESKASFKGQLMAAEKQTSKVICQWLIAQLVEHSLSVVMDPDSNLGTADEH